MRGGATGNVICYSRGMTATDDRPTMPPAVYCDQVRRAFDAHQCTREEAVIAIRSVLDVTAQGAEEMLDHPLLPSARYEVTE